MTERGVRIGLMPPISGLVELYGREISRAGKIACDEINAAGGVLGKPLELIIVDDGSLPETAVPAALRLVDEFHCSAIIGNLLSNSRIAVADRVSVPKRIPYLNFSFYEGSIHNRYFFHFAALPNQQIDKMIPYMAEYHGEKMYFAGSNYEWPRGSIEAAKRALIQLGGEIVGEDYQPLGQADMESLLEKVAKSGADVFVPYFAGLEQMELLNRFTARGLKERMAVVMGHYDEVMCSNLTPEVREGFYSSNTYFMGVPTEENHAYLRRMAREPGVTGIWPEGNGLLTNFGEGAYLCVHAFARAANKAGSVECEELVTALENVVVNGPQGRVEMDPATHHASVNSYLSRCNRDGTFTIVSSFGQIAPEIPEHYRPAAGNRVYQGEIEAAADRNVIALRSAADRSLDKRRTATGVICVDRENRILFVNRAAQALWGDNEADTLVGREIESLWDPDAAYRTMVESLQAGREWTGRLQARGPGGEVKTVELIAEPQSQSGFIMSFVGSDGDRRIIPDRLMNALSCGGVGIIAANEAGIIIDANDCACELFGYSREEFIGLTVHLLLPPRFRDGHVRMLEEFLHSSRMEIPLKREGSIYGYDKDGAQFPMEASVSKSDTEEGRVLIVTIRDLTKSRQMEEVLIWKATRDPLTKLPNRSLITDRLTNALYRTGRSHTCVALLFIDVDNFKLVNDSYGHETGDKLLQAIGDILVNMVRPGDTVARFGGDEFIVLCDHVDEGEKITFLADRVNEMFRQPIRMGEELIYTTVSIGLAYGNSDNTADELLRNADAAMYLAKEQGRDGWKFSDEMIHSQSRQRLQIATGLRTAIEGQELYINCQGIVDAYSEEIVGMELLLRWRSAIGEISPGVFVPIAEMTGSILPIGMWVFEQACLLEVRSRNAVRGKGDPYISVNVSTRQLDEDSIVEKFQEIIQRVGANPERILLEITETSLMSNIEANLKVLQKLSTTGMSIVVDDFGTGYSSLSQLLHMPVSTLKVDRLFVHNLEKSRENRTVIAAVIGMAHTLGMKVTAEGVETREQLQILREMGCDYIQGFLFYRPVVENEFMQLLHAGSGCRAAALN